MLFTLLTVALVVLKLLGVLSISWLVAFSPILIGIALWLIIVIVIFGFGVLGMALSTPKVERFRR